MDNLAHRFIRWSAGFLVLGLVTGYGPLGHYLMGGVKIACPWAPVHGHVALLGWLGMAVFGLVYKAFPSPALRLATIHFYACVVGVLGVFANGIIGYRILGRLSDDFYYKPETSVLNLWLTIDGVFLSVYGVGCVLFLMAVTKSSSRPVDESSRAISTT